jgi:hypothetical protein
VNVTLKVFTNTAEEAIVWDVGTGKAVHNIKLGGQAGPGTMYGNAVAVCESIRLQNLHIYDLTQSTSEPVTILEYTQDKFLEVHMNEKVVCAIVSGVIWLAEF